MCMRRHGGWFPGIMLLTALGAALPCAGQTLGFFGSTDCNTRTQPLFDLDGDLLVPSYACADGRAGDSGSTNLIGSYLDLSEADRFSRAVFGSSADINSSIPGDAFSLFNSNVRAGVIGNQAIIGAITKTCG